MKKSLSLALVSFLNLLCLFLFQWYCIAVFGSGTLTDALFAGFTVPQWTLTVVSTSLLQVLVPILVDRRNDLGLETWRLLVLVCAGACGITFLLERTASAWVPLLVPGFDASAVELTVQLTRIQILAIIPQFVLAVQWASYHVRQSFLLPELVQLITHALAIMALLYFGPQDGVFAAAWLVVGRSMLQVILLSRGHGPFRLTSLRPDVLWVALRRLRPLVAGAAYYRTDFMLDRFLLSMGKAGDLTLFQFGVQCHGAGGTILGKVFSGPLLPHLAEIALTKNWCAYRDAFRSAFVKTALIAMTGYLIFAVIGKFALLNVSEGSRLTSTDIDRLWLLMMLSGGVLIIGAVSQVVVTAIYAIGETIAPTKAAVISYTVSIPVKVTAFYFFGSLGLAIAVTLYYLFSFIALWRVVQQYIPEAQFACNTAGNIPDEKRTRNQ